MNPNIGRVNALIRISLGFTMLSWSSANLIKGKSICTPLFIASMGGMKIGEGITRFCPLTYFIQKPRQSQGYIENDHHQDPNVLNPS